MRLYAGKIPVIGAEIIKALIDAEDISVTDRAEADLDVQAVLKEYLRLEREITDKAKDLRRSATYPTSSSARSSAPSPMKRASVWVMKDWSG